MVIISPVPAPYSRNEERIDDMAEVVVAGLMGRPMGGTKESVAAFHKHHADLSRQLLNVSQGLDKDDPAPVYVKQEFPMMVYNPSGNLIVNSREELQDAESRGYRQKPYPKPQVAMNDPKTEKVEALRREKELQGQLTAQQDEIAQLRAEMREMMAQKRGPGRPPAEKVS